MYLNQGLAALSASELHVAPTSLTSPQQAKEEGISMPEVPESTPVDLDRFSEGLRRWLYDRVVQIQFSLQDSAAAYTPDEAGLQVVCLGGRWFALWADPNQ